MVSGEGTHVPSTEISHLSLWEDDVAIELAVDVARNAQKEKCNSSDVRYAELIEGSADDAEALDRRQRRRIRHTGEHAEAEVGEGCAGAQRLHALHSGAAEEA